MSDDLRRLERTLAEMPLRRPPASLDAKVLRRRRAGPWLAIGGLVAAAAIVIAPLLLRDTGMRQQAPVRVNGVQAQQSSAPLWLEETFSNLSYDGLFAPDDKAPMRVFRRRSLQRIWLVDQQSGYTVEMNLPDEQVILMDAEMY